MELTDDMPKMNPELMTIVHGLYMLLLHISNPEVGYHEFSAKIAGRQCALNPIPNTTQFNI